MSRPTAAKSTARSLKLALATVVATPSHFMVRRRRHRFQVLVLAAGALILSGISAAPALADLPLTWSSRAVIDHSDPFSIPTYLLDVSCPSATLCVAVDSSGNVVTSTNPTGGAAAWHIAHVDGDNRLSGVSCPSATLCVAVDSAGNVVTATNPTGGAAAWHIAHVDGSNYLTGVSCPSATLCVAVDGSGNALTSTNPTGGSAAWTLAHVDHRIDEYGLPAQLMAISCSSASLCVAVDDLNNVVTSTNPTGGAAAWRVANVEGVNGLQGGLQGVSCPSAMLCVAVDDQGNVVTSTNPTGGAAAWRVAHVGDSELDVSCPSTTLCVALASAGNVVTSTNPTGGAAAWTLANVDGLNPLLGVSCPSATLCVAVDSGDQHAGARLIGTPTPPHTLTVQRSGTGSGKVTSSPAGISCGSTCSHRYANGPTVNLTASPASGSSFSGWSGGGCSGTGSCHVTLGSNKTVTASFTKLISRSLTLSYRNAIHAFKGKLSASVRACKKARTVKVFKKRPGPDKKIGQATTSSRGSYKVSATRHPGKYYSKSAKTLIPTAGLCAAVKSPTLTLH